MHERTHLVLKETTLGLGISGGIVAHYCGVRNLSWGEVPKRRCSNPNTRFRFNDAVRDWLIPILVRSHGDIVLQGVGPDLENITTNLISVDEQLHH